MIQLYPTVLSISQQVQHPGKLQDPKGIAVYVCMHLFMHSAQHSGCGCGCASICVCECQQFLEGIDLNVFHRKVLMVQSLLQCSLRALPTGTTLMFHFPVNCFRIKGKKKKERGVPKWLPIKMPIHWRSGGSFPIMQLRGQTDIHQYSLKHTYCVE